MSSKKNTWFHLEKCSWPWRSFSASTDKKNRVVEYDGFLEYWNFCLKHFWIWSIVWVLSLSNTLCVSPCIALYKLLCRCSDQIGSLDLIDRAIECTKFNIRLRSRSDRGPFNSRLGARLNVENPTSSLATVTVHKLFSFTRSGDRFKRSFVELDNMSRLICSPSSRS